MKHAAHIMPLLLFLLLPRRLHADDAMDLVRIYTPDIASLPLVLANHLDIVYLRRGAYVEILATDADMEKIRSLPLKHEIIVEDTGRCVSYHS